MDYVHERGHQTPLVLVSEPLGTILVYGLFGAQTSPDRIHTAWAYKSPLRVESTQFGVKGDAGEGDLGPQDAVLAPFAPLLNQIAYCKCR